MKKNNAVDQYNALEGKKVTRKELVKLRDLAVNQLQQHVVDEINEFLLNNPAPFLSAIFEKEYEISIPKKLTWIPTGTGLGAARHSGLAKEALSECGRLLPGFKYEKGGSIVKVEKKPKKSESESESESKSVTERSRSQKKNTLSKDVSKKLGAITAELEVLETSLAELEKELEGLRKEPYSSENFKKRDVTRGLIAGRKVRQSKLMNLFVCLKNGGDITSITDKKGKKHEDIADFTKILTSQIEWEEESILNSELPPYIPILDQESLQQRGFVFDAIRVDENTYLTATKDHKEDKPTEYVLLTLDQLVLTSDYYLTFQKAIYRKAAKERTERNEKHWDSLPDERKKRYYDQSAQRALYNTMPATIKKTISFEKWTALGWKEKEKVYKFYKRVGPKRIKSRLGSNEMWGSMHKMYERFVNPKATNPRPRIANPEVFEYWKNFREFMQFKMLDIGVHRGDYSDARKKGMETSFGDSNLSDALYKEHGVLIKRQNGDKISPKETEEISEALTKIESVYGSLKPLAKAYGLKVSHTENTLVYARRALGVYWPTFRIVTSSMKMGKQYFANILAHELAHFLDNQKGLMSGQRYESDNYESTAGKLAMAFRRNMNRKTNSNYLNSTKECFARAFEQYFAIRAFGDTSEVKYVEMQGDVKDMSYYEQDSYVAKGPFEKEVVPFIEKFLKDIPNIDIAKQKGLGAPDRAVKFLTRQMEDIGLGGVAATLALNTCGRLKPGYKFLKGGEIIQVEKPKKSSLKPKREETKKTPGNTPVKKDTPAKDVFKTESKPNKTGKKKVWYPTVNGKRINNINYGRLWEAEKLLKNYQEHLKKKDATGSIPKKEDRDVSKKITSLAKDRDVWTNIRQLKNSSLPILENVWLKKNGTIVATDLETNIIYILPHLKELPKEEMLLPKNDFIDILRKMDVHKIEPSGWITGSKGKLQIKLDTQYKAKDFPSLPTWDGLKTVTTSFKTDVVNDMISYIAAKDDLRPTLSGVYFDANNKSIVATDAHILSWKENDVKESVIVPRNLKLPKGSIAPLKVSKNGINGIIDFKNASYIFRVVDGNFPNWKSVVPTTKKETGSVKFSKDEILEWIVRWDKMTKKDPIAVGIETSSKKLHVIDKNSGKVLSSKKIEVGKKDGADLITFDADKFIRLLKFLTEKTVEIVFTERNRAGIANETNLIMPVMLYNAVDGLGAPDLFVVDTKKTGSTTNKKKVNPKKKKGLGDPIILDAGKPYTPATGLEAADSFRDATAVALGMSVTDPETVLPVPEVPVKRTVPASTAKKSGKYKTAHERLTEKGSQNPPYQIMGDLRRFLGNIEVKPIQSLAITIDTEEGGGKTHTIYDWADKFATAGYRPIIWSLEEHASSNVSKDKVRKYFSPQNQHVIAVESEGENESNEALGKRILESFHEFDIAFIDSWGKLKGILPKLEFDRDIRKKYNGKLFVVIFQRTSDGKMRGGSDSAFDGDIIIKGEVDRGDYKNNYLYNHKNRYNDYSPISDLKWSGHLRGLHPIEVEVQNENQPPYQYPVDTNGVLQF